MKYLFRNYTIEYLFDNSFSFSGYGDINKPDGEYDEYTIFYQLNPSFTPEEQVLEVEEIKSKISFILGMGITERIVIVNLYRNTTADWQLKDRQLLEAIDNFNNHFLREKIQQYSNVKVLDINIFCQNQTLSLIDWRFFFTAQMVINPKLAKNFKKWYQKQTEILDLKRKKCIVLDCDNTLWGGIVGEDGTHGIQLGMDYPGICFKNFQNLLLQLSQKGVILAVCSKNNLKDVQDVWENNPNNLINSDVLSAYRINWQDKVSNIKSIAEELNIGTDSIVFIDDNPMERNLVKNFLPEVEIPEFPKNPYELIDFFWEIYHQYFAVYELSQEDIHKTQQYKENFFRNESKKAFENIDEYIESLEIQVDIFKANESNITRIAQMTQKTNQFNLTTKRYTEEQLKGLLDNGASIFCANVKDKFGDNGITIASIITESETELYLDSYLLSCRILGRDIEKITLLKILEKVNEGKHKKITARYIPTKKNIMARDFLEKIGFQLEKTDAEGNKFYIFDETAKQEIKEYYTITFI